MKTIVLASNNSHKVKEFQTILSDYIILSLKDIGFLEDIVEDGDTFLDNALIKARAIYDFLKEKNLEYDIVADDSGLCINALNGDPGVHSARFAGDHDNQKNRDKVMRLLKDESDKSAFFICQLVLLHPDGSYQEFSGTTQGTILLEERGSKDFCYDCIFYSTELNKTFGEASEEEKNSVSHRGRAIQKMLSYLNQHKNQG